MDKASKLSKNEKQILVKLLVIVYDIISQLRNDSLKYEAKAKTVAQQLKGENNAIVGSKEYFKKINRKYDISKIMKNDNEFCYFKDLGNINSKINFNLIRMKNDLTNSKIKKLSNKDKNKIKDFICDMLSMSKITMKNTLSIKHNSKIIIDNLFSNPTTIDYEKVKTIIKNKYLTKISEKDRISIINAISKKGLNYIKNLDKDEKLFVNKLQRDMNITNIEGFREVSEILGNSSKHSNLISIDDYLNEYKMRIFGFLNTTGKGYSKIFKDDIYNINKDIENDLNKFRFKNYIVKDNVDRILNFSDEMKKLNIIFSFSKKKIVDEFLISDITKDLENIFAKAKEITLRENLLDKTVLDRMGSVVKYVNAGEVFDLKSQQKWQKSKFIFKGCMIRSDAPGNILYGYFMADTQISSIISKLGAAAAQINDNALNGEVEFYKGVKWAGIDVIINFFRYLSLFICSILKGDYNPEWLNTYSLGDDPMDTANLLWGYKLNDD